MIHKLIARPVSTVIMGVQTTINWTTFDNDRIWRLWDQIYKHVWVYYATSPLNWTTTHMDCHYHPVTLHYITLHWVRLGHGMVGKITCIYDPQWTSAISFSLHGFKFPFVAKTTFLENRFCFFFFLWIVLTLWIQSSFSRVSTALVDSLFYFATFALLPFWLVAYP